MKKYTILIFIASMLLCFEADARTLMRGRGGVLPATAGVTATVSTKDGAALITGVSPSLAPYAGRGFKLTLSDGTNTATGYLGPVGTGPAYGPELVTHGDGSSTDGWTNYYGNETLTSEAGGKGGSNCFQIAATAAGGAGVYQDITVEPGKAYTFSAYAKAGTEATYRVVLYDNTHSVALYNTNDTEETAGDWSTHITKTVTAPADCTQFRVLFRIEASGAGGTFFWDDLSLKAIATPSNTGAPIYSTRFGTIQNWTTNGGVDPNAASFTATVGQ